MVKKNYKYGQIKNNQLCYAPNILVIGNEQIINAPAETYKSQGYLPIERTEQPEAEEGFYYSPIYIEDNNKIIQQWKKVAIPDEATESDYIKVPEELKSLKEKANAYDILTGVSE